MAKSVLVTVGVISALVTLALPPPFAQSVHTNCSNVKVWSDGGETIVYHDNNNCQIVYAKGGNDDIHTGGGDDDVYAGNGDDYAEGEADHDNLYGNEGNDYLAGRAGNDHVQDSQAGGSDQDRLCAGYGFDFVDSEDGDHIDIRYMKIGDAGPEDDGDAEREDSLCPV